MSDAELDTLEAKAKAVKSHIQIYCDPAVHTGHWVGIQDDADAEFIAAANPSAILELIAELRQAQRKKIYLAESLASCHTPGCDEGKTEYWLDAAQTDTTWRKNYCS